MEFSIIIPTYNCEEFIDNNIHKLLKQTFEDFEIIVIDDCSTDKTLEKVKSIKDKRIKIFKTKENLGPGIARNIGIENASGKWILFLDADDTLEEYALEKLYEFIKENNVSKEDIVTFDWKYSKDSEAVVGFNGRYDFEILQKSKIELIKNFISLGVDGSVIFTLFPKEFLQKNKVKFSKGFHEDIFFMFLSYLKAKKIYILDDKLYVKYGRKASIVNTISKKHINGYFENFYKFYNVLKAEKILQGDIFEYLLIGIINTIAVEVQYIWRNSIDEKKKYELYKYLYKKITEIEKFFKINLEEKIKQINKKTKFFYIALFFIKNFIKNKNSANLIKNLDEFLDGISNKHWSCFDIHNSLFLSYEEIRTCCKRFFDNGKMKGDVVLLKTKDKVSIKDILRAKQDLFVRLNRDEAEECRNCPYLEFKEWGRIENLDITHLSLEYHSVCNMKCSYCSEDFYGGKKANYNVVELIKSLKEEGSLDNLKTVVWGGGEPLLDNNFEEFLDFIIKSFPHIKPRIITNATIFSNLICKLLKEDRISITTSIDAGTKETFKTVRKNSSFYKVLDNLKRYSECDIKGNITIKYIILEENRSLEELENFAKLIKKYQLLNSNFQISYNFKKDHVDKQSLISIIILYGLLLEYGAKVVFIDDLIRQRLNVDYNTYSYIKTFFKNTKYEKFLFNIDKYKEIVIWGAGIQTKQLLKNSFLLKNIKIAYIVDDDDNKIGKKISGIKVKSPTQLKKDNLPVLISASQSTPVIIKRFDELKIDKSRIIKQLIF